MLIQLLRNPVPTLIFLGAILALVIFAAVRATWTPVAPVRVARRRSWGQIISASARMYVKRPRLFLGLGLLLIPIAVAITLVQWLLLEGIDLVGVVTGEAAGSWAFVAAVVGATFTLLGLALVQAATACALVEIDADRRDRAEERVPPRLAPDPAARRRDRALRRGLDRADGDRRSSSRSRSGSRSAGALRRRSSCSRIAGRTPHSVEAASWCGAAGSGSARWSA